MYYKVMFNDSCSFIFSNVMHFHDEVVLLLLLMSFFMLFTLLGVWVKSSLSSYFLEDNYLEVVWTLVPAFILLLLSFPSLFLLYYMDSPMFYGLGQNIMKVEGHQWYWSYNYEVESSVLNYDSFMVPLLELKLGGYRLLETDKPVVMSGPVILQGTTSDVMHSWACPVLGVKFDVVPGRLNSFSLVPVVLGSFYGQCSEICGANHSFMPMEVEVMN